MSCFVYYYHLIKQFLADFIHVNIKQADDADFCFVFLSLDGVKNIYKMSPSNNPSTLVVGLIHRDRKNNNFNYI